MSDHDLLLKCNSFFRIEGRGLVYKCWRQGLPKSCIGKRAGNDHHSGYKYIKIDGKLYAEHRLIWLMTTGKLPEMEIDHIDGDKQNSEFSNLRLGDRSENCANRKGWSKSGFKGVYPTQRGRPWQAQITVNGETVLLGRHDSKEDAARAYDVAAIFYKGEFAKLNYPKENYQ